jgi:hypothetical protein
MAWPTSGCSCAFPSPTLVAAVLPVMLLLLLDCKHTGLQQAAGLLR